MVRFKNPGRASEELILEEKDPDFAKRYVGHGKHQASRLLKCYAGHGKHQGAEEQVKMSEIEIVEALNQDNSSGIR